jgi:ribonuclease HI
LNFKNLCSQNIAMGVKIIWRIIAPNPGWAHLALWKKYFKGQRTRCLDNPLPQIKSSFLNLCAKVIPLINSHAFWIPGNGKSINVWNDRIMNKAPLAECSSLQTLRLWLDDAGYKMLWDLSLWNGLSWVSWKQIHVPPELQIDCAVFFSLLHGMAPIHARRKDTRGWGSMAGGFSVAQGYAKLLEQPYVPPDPAPWKGIWNHSSIPKVDFFCWLLCHRKILTDDRLQKRGIYGPSRCILCRENVECARHLVLECKFASQIWHELLGTWRSNFVFPSSTSELFANWLPRYPGPFPKNKIIKAAWTSLPKIISWQIWLERNKRIFRNKEQDAKFVVIKIKCQLKECLGDQMDDSNLCQQDIDWGASFDLQFQKAVSTIIPPKEWQIRENEKDFYDWISKQSRHSLFFDGAAKGNPGKAGAGGVIKNLEGRMIHSFAWGLGHTSSIQAEAMALFQGLKYLKDLGISEVNVFGDSQAIIKTIVINSAPSDLRFARLISRIKVLAKSFQNLKFFHVLRTNNKDADLEANKAVLLSVGSILRDRDESWDPIP